jgi:hypothetical protein
MSSQPHNRKSIRFQPDPLAVAHLDVSSADDIEFQPTMVALIMDEAPLSGCGLVMKSFGSLKPGLCLRIKVGEMAPLIGTVRWVRPLDHTISRVGIEFLE